MREWEIGAVENIHGALPYIRFAPILALVGVGVGVNRIGKVSSLQDITIFFYMTWLDGQIMEEYRNLYLSPFR